MRELNRGNKSNEDENAIVVLDGYDSVVLNLSDVDLRKEWIIDSICLFHMCPTKLWFESFTNLDEGHVILGNNKSYKIMGIGSIGLKMFNGMEMLLQEIIYISKLKKKNPDVTRNA